jgi:sarcosine oxidase
MDFTSGHYDVIVVGIGGMGSATVYQLARRGLKVLGLERYSIPNQMGSSHGMTRIMRLAYYQNPAYVPLVRRAYDLWRSLQDETGEQILYVTGSIDAGPKGSRIVEGSRKSCELNGLPYEILTSSELTARFPGYRLPPEILAVLQPDGGFLLPERCIVSHVTMAQAHGACIHAHEQVLNWKPSGNGVQVTTDRATYFADRLVITSGAWSSKLIDGLSKVIVPERQVMVWFQPRRPELFTPERFPVFNLMVEEGHYYGCPIFGVPGFKFGRSHHLSEKVDPDTINRECNLHDEQVIRKYAELFFPEGAGPTMALATCMYANTADENFIIDIYPDYPQVSFAAGFSGHGFKFCSLVGEIMADLIEYGETHHDIQMFRSERLKGLLHQPEINNDVIKAQVS